MSDAPVARGWIQSPRFDLATFILVPLSSLVVLGAVRGAHYGTMVVVAATYLVGIPHYLSSFTFFLGDDNLRYYQTRTLAFFVGPVVIFAAVIALRLGGLDAIVLNAMFLWNIWHVSLQSAGILTLYRRLNSGPLEERAFAHPAILLVNATMALWFVDRFPPLYDVLVAVHPATPGVLRWALLCGAVVALAAYGRYLARRPSPLSTPESAFLASSLVLFVPYLWVKDSNLATFAMLMGHFIQYLSIVWLLNRRKYAGHDGTWHQRLLGSISARPVYLGGTIVVAGLAFYGTNQLASRIGAPMAYIILWNALTLVHFYLDGLIWAFRQPFVRQSIGTYLVPPARIAGT